MDEEVKRLLAIPRAELPAYVRSLSRKEQLDLMCRIANVFSEHISAQPDAVFDKLEPALKTHQPSQSAAADLMTRLTTVRPEC